VYIDDILIFGKDFDHALLNLCSVLDRIASYGLQLKSSKCHLFRPNVAFLGHIVGRNGLSCDPAKLEAVKEWSPPRDVKGVREFLGFAGYYRRFVPNFANIAAPLVALTSKNCTFVL